MRKRRLALVTAALLAACIGAEAGQPTPSAATPPRQNVQKGACDLKARDGSTICRSGLDAGACTATGREGGMPTTFKPGEACP